MSPATPNVVLVIGAGDIGIAIARRIAQGRKLLIASRSSFSTAVETLRKDGHDVSGHQVDITSYPSVQNLAHTASTLGNLNAIILTSGISSIPGTDAPQDVFAVDLIGTANVIDAFLPYVGHGSSVVCLSSSAAYDGIKLSASLSRHFAIAPRESLLDNAEAQDLKDSMHRYSVSKKGNMLRVQAAARAYGLKGARINSVSPGLIVSKMGQTALESKHGEMIARRCIEGSAMQRLGTVEDIANVVEFLVGPGACFVTGIDILVDGGVTANIYWGADKNAEADRKTVQALSEGLPVEKGS